MIKNMTNYEIYENKLKQSKYKKDTYQILGILEKYGFDLDNLPRYVGSKIYGNDVYQFISNINSIEVKIEKKKVKEKEENKENE